MSIVCGHGTSKYQFDYCNLSVHRHKANKEGCPVERGQEINELFKNMRTRRKEKKIGLKKLDGNDMIGLSRVQYSCLRMAGTRRISMAWTK